MEFEDDSRGSLYRTSITGSAGAGLDAEQTAVRIVQVQLFDNQPGFSSSARW